MDTAAMPLFLVQHELMREEAEQITPDDIWKYGDYNVAITESNPKRVDFSYGLHRGNIVALQKCSSEWQIRGQRMYVAPVEYEISQDNGFERKRLVHKEGAD